MKYLIDLNKSKLNVKILSGLLIISLTLLITVPEFSCKSAKVPELVTPVYTRLKEMATEINLVKGGKASSIIVTPALYKESALLIQEAIEKRTGTKVPVVSDTDPQAAVPFKSNLIIIGNRSTSKISGELYDRFYSLIDLKYPGPKGYAIRSLHDPYADGYSAVLVGGSDNEGVAAGAMAFIDHLEKLPVSGKNSLSVGWTMLTKAGEGVNIPSDIKDFAIWEASNRYGSVGYFGWNSISKRMAMYYMTGDPFHAREVIRLSFPDAQAIKEIDAIDGERIENKKDPLAGPYHYNAMMLILFWDLIEESPAFTDAERLNVTNAFARRFEHEGTTPFDKVTYKLDSVPAMVGSRHHQYSGLSILTLGRYFNKYYPAPMWAQAERAGKLVFAPLQNHSYIESFGDPGSYSTGLQPILTYMLLTGDKKPLESGSIDELLRGYEILMNGSPKEAALSAATIDFLNKAAYITGDGRWITYRQRTGMDTDIFRLGQSFWPEENLKPAEPEDLAGKWTLRSMPEGMWKRRNNQFTPEQSFENVSYRSSPDSTGDYILLKGFNAAYSNPYHTLSIIELRLNGATLLKGYNNQVLSSADGMVEPEVPMDAALLYHDVTGGVATAVAKVLLPFTDWERSLVQRTGKYVLIADNLTFRGDSKDANREMVANIETQWGIPRPTWVPGSNHFKIYPGDGNPKISYELHSSDIMEVKTGEVASMNWNSPVKDGRKIIFFHLIGQKRTGTGEELASLRLADNAAALLLPEAAIAVEGKYENILGELVLLSEKNLYGHSVTNAGLKQSLFSSDLPVDTDWDFNERKLVLQNKQQVNLSLAITSPTINLDGKDITGTEAGGAFVFAIPAGRHSLTGIDLQKSLKSSLKSELTMVVMRARKSRGVSLSKSSRSEPETVPEMTTVFKSEIGGPPAESIIIPSKEGEILCTATGNTITLFDSDGKIIRNLTATGDVRVLNWWNDYKLLLAGCSNEEVIAFDEQGNQKWTFTSLMDPAVYEAGKPYWFKSRDPGIYGLHSGEFDNGKSRAFVGSACTLEILDENGQLVKRTPVFWGPGRQFLIVKAADGSKNLLIGRWRNGYNTLSVVNSKEMKEIDRAYNDVPEGHTFIDGWTSMSRYDNYLTDLEGDGKREIVSALNGTWNRVTIYTEDGKPVYNAQFGPGTKGARTNLRMMDVGDLEGDGKQEIVVGLSSGFINVLDNHAEKKWARLLKDVPTVVKIVKDTGSTWIIAGCENGSVFAIGPDGNILKASKISGRPIDLQIINSSKGKIAVITTEAGEINGFRLK